MADYRRARWGLRRTFQTEMAIEQLSVFDNVAMIHEHSGAKRASRRADVLAAIEFVGLEAPPKAKVGGLGARERRLVEVARAVVGQPARRPARRACGRASPTRRPSTSAR